MAIQISAFKPKELSLIKGYANRCRMKQYGNLDTRQVSYYPYSGFGGGFRYGVGKEVVKGIHNFFFSRKTSKNDSKESKNNFVIAALGASILYMLYAIPNFYFSAKEYYYTRKITQLSKLKGKNYYDKKVIKNLKELLKADQSQRFLFDQNINFASAMGVFTGTSSIMLGTYGEFYKQLQTFTKTWLPKKLHLADSSKLIKLITDENVIAFGKVLSIASIGLFTLNLTKNLWNDFFEDVNNPKEYLKKKSWEIERAVTALENGNTTRSFRDFVIG